MQCFIADDLTYPVCSPAKSAQIYDYHTSPPCHQRCPTGCEPECQLSTNHDLLHTLTQDRIMFHDEYKMPCCGAWSHLECLDIWFQRNTTCPNCLIIIDTDIKKNVHDEMRRAWEAENPDY